jgi:hypothetical protein
MSKVYQNLETNGICAVAFVNAAVSDCGSENPGCVFDLVVNVYNSLHDV